MLELKRIDGVEYYDTLSKSEYYADQSKGEPHGQWGAGVEKIGINPAQPVQNELLKIVMTGHKPDGSKMVQNAGKSDMRVGMDLVFSAPKSVSVLWANASPELREQISKAQHQATTKAMDYLRERIETRTSKGGVFKETPAALIYASFEHCNSRAKDPNLHAHTVLSNAVVRENGKTSALDQKGIYDHIKATGATYRAELAQQLRGMGFKLEEDKDNAGIFQIAGFDKDLERHFSKRSEVIKKIAAEHGVKSAAKRQEIAKFSRDKKTEIDRPALFERWQAESQERGFDAAGIEALKQATPEPFTMPTAEQIAERLTENESFFQVRDLERLLAECGQYHDFDREKMRDEVLQSAAVSKRILRLYDSETDKTTATTVYTSKALVNLEQNSIDSAKNRKTETRHHLPAATVKSTIQRIEQESGFTLRDEQREAVEFLTQKSGGIALMRGLAGTGKTTALKAVCEAYKAEGFKVYGATLSAQAAGILSAETGLKGATIAQTLIDLDKGKTQLSEKSVLLIDEAGMVGSRDFARLQAHADKAGAKLIAVGDEKQIQAIAAGGIFEALQFHAELGTADLKQITRQQDGQDREASRLFYEGKADEALKIYEAKGQIKTHKHRDSLMIQLARDYAQDPNETTQKMAIAATNAEAVLLNEQIREELKSAGKLDRDTGAMFENADGNTLEISKGDRVLFKKNSKARGVNNNLRGTVLECRQSGESAVLKIQGDDGKTRTIDTSEYPDLRHAYAVTGHASQGATVQKSFVLFNRGTADLSWGYVSMTRHKDRATLYATEADKPELAEKFSKANFKGTTLDLPELTKVNPEQANTQEQGSAPSTAQGLASSAGKGQQSATGEQMPQQAAKAAPQATQGAQVGNSSPPQAGQAGGVQQSSTNPAQKINWAAIEQESPSLAAFLKISMAGGGMAGGDAQSQAAQQAVKTLFESLAAGASQAAEKGIAERQSNAQQQAHIQRQGAEMER